MEEFFLSSDKPSCLMGWSLMGVLVTGVPGASVEFRGEEGEDQWLDQHFQGVEQL